MALTEASIVEALIERPEATTIVVPDIPSEMIARRILWSLGPNGEVGPLYARLEIELDAYAEDWYLK